MSSRYVFSVGQCYADRALKGFFEVDVITADTADEALSLLRNQDF